MPVEIINFPHSREVCLARSRLNNTVLCEEMKKRIGKIIVVGVVVLMALFMCHTCSRRMVRPDVELTWRHFADDLSTQHYDDAFRSMSRDYQRNHSTNDFVAAWSKYDWQSLVTSNRDITVVYLGSFSPLGGRCKVFVSTSHLYLPLPLEDGFMGVHVDLVKEDDMWKILDFPFAVEGR